MSLLKYRKKRSFDRTPEPTGGKGTGQKLTFVVQKHAASHLHYDFRLEMDGVLKSWAVPKGPSLNPSDKRLAMMVEDHPYNYKNFEGIIPKGNYGAGTVIVWDQGTYEPVAPVKNRDQAEKLLLKELKLGSVKIALHGKKLKGEFALVHTSGRGDNAWLLIKHRDKFASDSDVTLKDKSVLSGKTLAKMESSPDKVYGQKTIQPGTTEKDKSSKTGGRAAEKIKKVTSVKEVKKTTRKTASLVKTRYGVKAPFPTTIKPMLATLVDHAPSESGWLYEIKWDGYRAIALCNKSDINIISRNNKSFNMKFYPVLDALRKLKCSAVFDGEICVLKDTGVTSFNALQNWRSEADGELVYYVFDLLWLNGYSLMEVPLTTRRGLLHKLIPIEGIIRESQNFEASPEEFLAAAGKMGLEGIIAKRADSAYLPDNRGSEWLKIKVLQRHEVVIGGYTKNDDSPKAFSALLVGVYDNGKLEYTGKIGTGFNDKMQKEMMAKFKPLLTKKSPFTILPDVNKPSRFRPNPPHAQAFWLKPSLVCEVSYTEMTADGVMRHPSFEGLREDKAAIDVHAEVASRTEDVIEEEAKPTIKKKQVIKRNEKAIPITPVKKGERKTLLNPSEEAQVKAINGHELKFSNLSKVFWPEEGYTKRDLLNYYYQAAPYIMPYLKDRPQSMNRYPNGIEGKSFYFKDVTATAPDWINQFPYRTSEGEDKNFLVAEDEASLLWMANLGAIEMNPWNCTIHAPENPTWCLIDLDPTDKNTFEQVIETANVTKQVLDALGVPSYPKTSGSTGIHVYIPLGAKYSFDECVLFAKLIATHVHQELPTFTSIERMTDKRKNKIYIDFLQNRPKATLAAPYSVRPKPQATVSMPLHWQEIKKSLRIADFTMKNAMARIKAEGDIFKPVLEKGIDISKALKKLA